MTQRLSGDPGYGCSLAVLVLLFMVAAGLFFFV